jgi:hypothetical protein
MRAAYWKQRGKVRVVKEADENTKFHHAHASHRLRPNQIRTLVVGGVSCSCLADKAKVLDDHFATLLGAGGTPSWDFDVVTMYADSAPVILPLGLSLHCR